MSIYSAGTDIGNAGTVKGSGANLSSLPAPTDAQILAGVAQTAAEVGSYAYLANANGGPYEYASSTLAGSALKPAGSGAQSTTTQAGTWRCMGYHADNNQRTVWLRYV